MAEQHTTIIIRKMVVTDLSVIEDIYKSVFGSNYISYSELHLGFASTPLEIAPEAIYIFHQELISIMENPDAACFVAILRNKVAGFTIVRMKEGANGFRECWLEDVMNTVHDYAVLRLLYKEVLKWAKIKNCQYIFFESNSKNKKLHRVAKRYGFTALCTIFSKAIE